MKRVALINDLSGFGKCSLTAAIPVISVMGIQACPLPTAILSAQTEFENYFCDDFTDRMDYFIEQWKQMEVSFEGIYSGYLASSSQIDKVLHFLKVFEKEDTLYLADPVMGDDGNSYDIFNEDFLRGMKKLTQKATIITPNLTELCLLADEDYFALVGYKQQEDYIKRIKKICERLLTKAERPQTVIVTGILCKKDNKEYVGSLAVTEKESFYLETPYTGMSFSGTGDLFASVICGSLVKGLSVKEAMTKATDFLQSAIEDASEKMIPLNHGVHFENYLFKLI
uniref:pyridoxamine kinase n=1 Tax=Acetatifactor sp. TaxID=1872090 RepID=UPI0040570B8B